LATSKLSLQLNLGNDTTQRTISSANLLRICYRKTGVMDFGKTCYVEVSNLLQICYWEVANSLQSCYGLVVYVVDLVRTCDTLQKSQTCYRLQTC